MKGLLQLVLLVSSLFLSLSVHACSWRFAAETEFPPHLLQDKEQRWHGQSVALVTELANRIGCRVTFRASPWLRALAELKTGELDVISHLYHNESREEDYYFIGPHHHEAIWLIGKPADFPQIKTLADLASLKPAPRIAVLNGAYYGKEFTAMWQTPTLVSLFVPIGSIQDKLALLNANRVNAILEDRSVLHYWQTHEFRNANLYQPIMQIYQAPVYFGFSKKTISKVEFTKLKQAWHEMEQDQTVRRIQQRYSASD